MTNILKIITVIVVFVFFSCSGDKAKYKTETASDKNGVSYEYVTNDPMNTRIYTLKNGLKVYLTQNPETPRIQTLIGVKAGSTYDPAETTGLAHYLEHMMFKGTSKIGSLNWEAESQLLNQISDLFEKHKNTSDKVEKKAIYHQIDSLSTVASQYAVPNEYDKLVALIGAKNTNAYTSNEETVYMNDIPANEIERWLKIESERFSTLVLRLFHTELEAVYEEFNMSQDNDSRKINKALYEGLFPTHPYGTQTTIGVGEHLKNPSMVNIHNYFDTYYVPNNMAICMSGDLDYESTITLIDKYWGQLPSREVPKNSFAKLDSISAPVIKEVYGPEAEAVELAYRFDGVNSDDTKYVTLINSLLYNRKAGLIDINLVQKQKILSAYAYTDNMIDYSAHVINATPRQNQDLEYVKDILLEQIEKVKKGEFEEWMLEAAINNYKLSQIRSLESNYRAFSMINAFINSTSWEDIVKKIDEFEKITKTDIVKFANKHYNNNYVVVYKRTGIDSTVMKVDKPELTPLNINRETKSEFFTQFSATSPEKLSPVYVDFKKEISESSLKSNTPFYYVKNPINEIFTLQYILEMGSNNDPKLDIAANYLPFLGTEKYSPEQFQQELYKLGLSFGVWNSDSRTFIYISGLDKSFEQGVTLFEELLNNVKPDSFAYKNYVDGLLKERRNSKLDKDEIIWNGLYNYGKYGSKSPFTNILSEKELRSIEPSELTEMIKGLAKYKPMIYYYGVRNQKEIEKSISTFHKIPDSYVDYPAETKFPELKTEKKVYFVNYEMVQTNIIMLSKDGFLNNSLTPDIALFNEYFGGGMASVVFQEIREAKALAYSAYAYFTTPEKQGESHYLTTFIATQVDKLKNATDAMNDLINNMPTIQKSFDEARNNIITQLETERIVSKNMFGKYLELKDKGIDYDNRKDIYEKMKTVTFDDFKKFYESTIKGREFTYLVIADKSKIDMKALSALGTVQELTLEEVFGY